MLYFESTLPHRGLNSYGFSACREQAMQVISDSKVHKPGKLGKVEVVLWMKNYFFTSLEKIV